MTPIPRIPPRPETILDGLTTAVLVLDDDLRVAALNTACENLFGISRRHALGVPASLAIVHLKPYAARLREALDAGTGFIEREMRLSRHDERGMLVDCTATPVLIERRTALLIEVLPIDRQLRISRDEQIHQQHEAARELIRGLAHEIKNPLGGIRGAAQLLAAEYPDSEHHEYTGVIIREVDRLQKLVDRLLGPNRAPQRSALNIHEVVEHVRQLIEAEAEGLCVQRDYDPSLPELVADREQLIQALLNIARNALQATGSQGRITLRTRARRQFTIGGVRHRLVNQVDIEDDGPGIDEAVRDKIFYPMVTTRPDGTGLGLPMAQYLIHAHGGLLECESRPGRTCFSIYLPLEFDP